MQQQGGRAVRPAHDAQDGVVTDADVRKYVASQKPAGSPFQGIVGSGSLEPKELARFRREAPSTGGRAGLI